MLLQSAILKTDGLTAFLPFSVMLVVILLFYRRFSAHASVDHLPMLGEKGQPTFFKTLEHAYHNV